MKIIVTVLTCLFNIFKEDKIVHTGYCHRHIKCVYWIIRSVRGESGK